MDYFFGGVFRTAQFSKIPPIAVRKAPKLHVPPARYPCYNPHMTEDPKHEIITKLAANPELAHSFLFAHRHPQKTPTFHKELINLWHSPALKVLFMAFRGGAKSTLAEEAITIAALFQRFKFGLVIGNSETRAVERLAAIKHEIEFNDKIQTVFGDQVGATWQDAKCVLANGTAIHAYGRGQSLRGAKHLEARPDIVFLDDLEDDESVKTPEQRLKTLQWFVSVLIPAMDPNYRMRVAGTPLDPESLLMQLSRAQDWVTRIYPIRYIDQETGKPKATWPERFSLDWVDTKEREYAGLGASQQFMQEYMCEASDPASKPFTADMIKIDSSLMRTWQPVYVFYDPARTTHKTSAMTGKVVFSWVNNRLIVWDAGGYLWKPDEIMADMFATDAEYSPIEVGIERDGLEEFLMQPIRQEQVRRQQLVPIQGYKAPKGKIDFIKSLQPFFKAGEIIFAKPLPDLVQQLMAFPTGKIDIPNALAYALRMRAGKIVYDNFRPEHVTENDMPIPRTQVRLALAANQAFTAGVMFQFHNGTLNVLGDCVKEGPPGDNVTDIIRTLSMASGATLRVYASPNAYSSYDQVGLLPALRQVPCEAIKGGPIPRGREEFRAMLTKTNHGRPSVQVSSQATWTLKALAGGYVREVDRFGHISDFPKENVYKIVMEALESVVSLAAVDNAEQDQLSYAYTSDGRRFVSARARARDS